MNRLRDRLVSSLLAFAFVAGCDDTDPKGWLVDRTRVLGLRIEAQADPSRAAIAPGEPMRARWLVGAPNGTGHLTWAYAICAPVIGNFPEPKCEGLVFVSGKGAGDGELATMELDAPSAAAVGDLHELQVLAAFCERGETTLDANHFEATCAGGEPARLASGAIRLAAAGPNRNPEIAADAVLFDGAPMAPATARPGLPCVAEASSPVVGAGTKHTFVLRFRGDERESLPEGGTVESVLASHVVTAGELERQYSMLDSEEAAPKDAPFEWTAPGRDQVGDGGRLAEVYVVVRDGRGGAAFVRRTVCVRR